MIAAKTNEVRRAILPLIAGLAAVLFTGSPAAGISIRRPPPKLTLACIKPELPAADLAIFASPGILLSMEPFSLAEGAMEDPPHVLGSGHARTSLLVSSHCRLDAVDDPRNALPVTFALAFSLLGVDANPTVELDRSGKRYKSYEKDCRSLLISSMQPISADETPAARFGGEIVRLAVSAEGKKYGYATIASSCTLNVWLRNSAGEDLWQRTVETEASCLDGYIYGCRPLFDMNVKGFAEGSVAASGAVSAAVITVLQDAEFWAALQKVAVDRPPSGAGRSRLEARLTPACEDGYARVRVLAARTLNKLGKNGMTDVLAPLAGHDSAEVRKAVVLALAEVGGEQAMSVLQERAAQEQDAEVRSAIESAQAGWPET